MHAAAYVSGGRTIADAFSPRAGIWSAWEWNENQCAIWQSHMFNSYLEKFGTAAIDSLRLRPNNDEGTLEIVTTECRRPPGWGAGDCDKVARNACSIGVGPDPSPPRSDSLRTWLAVIPLVHGGVGSECLRVSRGSRHGDKRYGFTGESMSKLWRGDDDFLLSLSSFSSCSDSSTTISGSWLLPPNGENDERRSFARVSAIEILIGNDFVRDNEFN